MAKKPVKKAKKPAAKKSSVKKPVVTASAPKKKAETGIGIQPLGDRIVVRPVAVQEVTASGFIIPDSAKKEKPERGEVVAVGSGKRLDDGSVLPLSVKLGDIVVFSRYGFEEVTIGDTEYYIINESNILAVVN